MQLNYSLYVLGLGAMIFAGTQLAMAETLKELDRKSGGGLFAPMWRTSVCEDVQNPFCPSIVRIPSGDLLLMFTHEPTGNAELGGGPFRERRQDVVATANGLYQLRDWRPRPWGR